jgi:hypothetical protein
MQNAIATIEEAADLLRTAQRILVIGCSGGGKTTLSRKLGQRLGLEHISMDRDFYWLPGWVKRAKAEERQMIAAAVANERWLMDGTGSSTFDLRMPRTDIVLWVRMPRLLCIWGAVSRWVNGSGGHDRRWRRDAGKGSMPSSYAISGRSRRISRRSSRLPSRHMAPTCRFFS